MPRAASRLIRRFIGVNQQIEPVFLGPQYLAAATNWIPDTTYLLTKRPGSTLVSGWATGTTWRSLLRTLSSAGVRYLYGYRYLSPSTASLYVSTDDGDPAAVTNGTFTTSGATGRLVVYGDTLYAGNGVDPIKRVPLGGSAVNLTSVAAFTNSAASPATVVADSGSGILTGTYSYAWGIYDHTNAIWVERSAAQTVNTATSGDVNLTFAAPAGMSSSLGPQYKAHLFIAPINLPVEFAHDHTPEGVVSSPTIIRQILADGTPLPLKGLARTGNILTIHRNRLWLAGDASYPNRAVASSILVPGLEQAIFNQGLFFPANAMIQFPEPVTALKVVSFNEGDNPQSPIAIFTTNRTYLWLGDIIDDPNSARVELSSRIGCAGADAVTATPFGLFFLGPDSVYRIPPNGGIPENIGWPIAPAVKAVPYAQKATAILYYHKGFLKCCFAPAGGSQNTIEYWLDLRNGLPSPPSWWGPHRTYFPLQAVATSVQETAEYDRAWGASGTYVALLHQPNAYTEGTTAAQTIVSTLSSCEMDHDEPFVAKNYALLRVIGKATAPTSIDASITTDSAYVWGLDTTLAFTGNSGGVWGTALWNSAYWSLTTFEESQADMPAVRPRGLHASITLTHSEATRIDLRDFDLVLAPVVRPKRANRLGGSPPSGA